MHFAGHGDDGAEGFVWEAAGGGGSGPEVVSRDTFADVVKRVGSLECVVLNACQTVQAGCALHAAKVPYVVCFDGDVPDKDGIEFCRVFYRHLSNRGNEQQYATAYEHACDWASHTRSRVTPCLLWNDGGQLDAAFTLQHGAIGTCSWKYGALPLHQERDTGAREIHGREILEEIVVDSDVASDAETSAADEIRNWRMPKSDRDWSAVAGVKEKAALTELGFNMKLNRRDVAEGNGVNSGNGFISGQVLALWGVNSYPQLWGTQGKAVAAAKLLKPPGAARTNALQRAAAHLAEAERCRGEDLKKHAGSNKAACAKGCRCLRCAHLHQLKLVSDTRSQLLLLLRVAGPPPAIATGVQAPGPGKLTGSGSAILSSSPPQVGGGRPSVQAAPVPVRSAWNLPPVPGTRHRIAPRVETPCADSDADDEVSALLFG